jgi:hypothetical protein
VDGTKTCSLNETVDTPMIEHCGTMIAEAIIVPTPEELNELTWVDPNCTEADPFAEKTPIQPAANETVENPLLISVADSKTCSLNATDAWLDNTTIAGSKTCSPKEAIDVPVIKHCGTMIAEATTEPDPEILNKLACVDENWTDATPDDDDVSRIALKADSITDAVPFAENAPMELATNEAAATPWMVSEAGSRTCSLNAADP